MDLDIKGLRVLVTAGAGGIGLAIARRFTSEGANVHTCDVDEMALSAIASSDPAITSTPCDVSNRSAVQRLFADAVAKLGGLDVLVNNAGIAGPTSKVEEMNPEDWDRCLEICLTGQFNCTRLAVPLLRNSKNASIKDYVTPEQLADQILFMCSPRGRTISGQAISICGDTQMLG